MTTTKRKTKPTMTAPASKPAEIPRIKRPGADDVAKVRATIAKAVAGGATMTTIAYRFGVNAATAYRWLKGLGPTGNRAKAALASWKASA